MFAIASSMSALAIAILLAPVISKVALSEIPVQQA
jgi:hypothetical protein